MVESSEFAKKAITIAIRYACVRRQFGSSPDGTGHEEELKIMDYQTHQKRLIPLLAYTYACCFTASHVRIVFSEQEQKLNSIGPDTPLEELLEVVSILKDVHGTSAGLKAFCTWRTLNLIEECRQSLGGLGYSSYTGLASLFADFAVECTWEVINSSLVD